MTFPADDKPALRKHLLALRREASAACPNAGERLVGHWPEAWCPDRTLCIAGYWPLPGEIDPRPLMARLRAGGHRICLPVVTGFRQPLAFREWAAGDPLVAGQMGVQEPASDRPTCRPDLVLVPLLGCDRAGNRIGFGKGYYDWTLAELRMSGPVLAIGLAFACQVVADLPAEAHDEPLDGVVTEAGAMAFAGLNR